VIPTIAQPAQPSRSTSYQASCSSQSAGDQAEVLILDGDFDLSNTAQLERALDNALHTGRPQLIVDLRGVSFLDATMLRVLGRGLGNLLAGGGQVALIRPNPTVWRVFVLTGLSESFHAFGRLDEALASFGLRS
jgi:anti-sigma B factor antagonist